MGRFESGQFSEVLSAHALRKNPRMYRGFRGEVQSYNAVDGTVRVSYYHADDTPTQTPWIPMLSPWGSAGYGLQGGIEEGAQVLLLHLDPDGDNLVALGCTFNDIDTSPGAPPSEFWTTDKRGS